MRFYLYCRFCNPGGWEYVCVDVPYQLQQYGEGRKEGRSLGVDILFGLFACECGKRVKIGSSGKETEQRRIKRLTSYILYAYTVSLYLSCTLNLHIFYHIILFYYKHMIIVYTVNKTCHNIYDYIVAPGAIIYMRQEIVHKIVAVFVPHASLFPLFHY